MNKKILIIAIIVLVILAGVGAFMLTQKDTGNEMSREDAVNKALDYINAYLLQGGSAQLVQIYESEDANLYKFQINVQGQDYDSVVTKDGATLFTNPGIDLNEEKDEIVDGGFAVKKDAEIITQDGKPVIHLFTSSSCPHCAWQKPIMETMAEEFGDAIVVKILEDSEEDQEVYTQFGQGGVPLVILGGKYYREGAGENNGEEEEKTILRNYICELTGNVPAEVCSQ